MQPRQRVAVGMIAAGSIAAVAHARNHLTRGGALATIIVGTAVFTGRGAGGTTMMLGFFVPSILLSRLGREKKRALHEVEKTGARDALQVFANGGLAAVAALFGGGRYRDAIFCAMLAAATADTWATEIGTVAGKTPHSILDGDPVAIGLSGGVTASGTLATLGGATWIAFLAALTRQGPFGATLVAGTAGALVDSILGAKLQLLRRCCICDADCETELHCGQASKIVRGMPYMNNDAVNAAAIAASCLTAALLTLPE